MLSASTTRLVPGSHCWCISSSALPKRLFFRAYVLRVLEYRWGSLVALIGSSAYFGLVHILNELHKPIPLYQKLIGPFVYLPAGRPSSRRGVHRHAADVAGRRHSLGLELLRRPDLRNRHFRLGQRAQRADPFLHSWPVPTRWWHIRAGRIDIQRRFRHDLRLSAAARGSACRTLETGGRVEAAE